MITFVLVIFYLIPYTDKNNQIQYRVDLAHIILSLTFLFAGGLIGFIFAIPRRISSNDIENKFEGKYIGNDNLVQISDWLTKILVGVGLVNLKSFPSQLNHFASSLSFASSSGLPVNTVIVEMIILFFSIAGFIVAYLWTRLNFVKILNSSEN